MRVASLFPAALLAFLALACGTAPAPRGGPTPGRARPNVLLIITDDQGYGDFSGHGNPHVRTPHLDRLAREGVAFTQFYVSPVCSPTRASLLTGRYSYRTGVVDTYLGRSLMRPEEVTLAERLRAAGYATGLFGKWHLGDNHPLRAQDQGFDETLSLKGGGIGQPSDPPGGDHYQDATLYRDGVPTKTRGYVTDVFTDGALDFIARRGADHQSGGRPFFAYVAYNAPHTPLEVPERYRARFARLPDAVARVYGMVENLDDNVGRLLDALLRQGLARDTLVLFLTDNGVAGRRYDAGLRGAKGSVWEGGIRAPLYARWPAGFSGGRTISQIAAHLDVLPTILAAVGVSERVGVPAGQSPPKLDGRDLLPLLRGDVGVAPRPYVVQWHRGDVPERGRSFAVREGRWKLVGDAPDLPASLFDLERDPAEAHDVAAEHADQVQRLRALYDAWFDDVTAAGFAPVRPHVGSSAEPRVVLTRQDWRGPRAGWEPTSLGHFELHVAAAGRYLIEIRFAPADEARSARVRLGDASVTAPVAAGRRVVSVELDLPHGDARLEAELQGSGEPRGAEYVTLSRR